MLYKEEKTITSNPYLDIETNLNANPTVKDKKNDLSLDLIGT